MSSVPVARPILPRWSSRILREHWPAVGVLSLVVASSYKWRVRDPTDAVSGSVDLSTLLEVAVYGLVALGLLVAFGRDLALRHPPRGPLALAACYTFLLVLSASYSPYPSYAVVRAAEALVVLGLAASIARRADRRQLRSTVHAFLVLVVLSVAYGVALPSPPVSALQVGRFTWLQIHPTVSSVFTALALVLAVGCATGVAGTRAGCGRAGSTPGSRWWTPPPCSRARAGVRRWAPSPGACSSCSCSGAVAPGCCWR